MNKTKCCNADYIVAGDTTHNYACNKCGKPTDTDAERQLDAVVFTNKPQAKRERELYKELIETL